LKRASQITDTQRSAQIIISLETFRTGIISLHARP